MGEKLTRRGGRIPRTAEKNTQGRRNRKKEELTSRQDRTKGESAGKEDEQKMNEWCLRMGEEKERTTRGVSRKVNTRSHSPHLPDYLR